MGSVASVRLAATVSVLALVVATPALSQTAPSSGATTVDDIIVTAQKREESIQNVPIAVSAFNAETLDAMKIEGGSELMRAIPNVSFSKNNFSMYNFSIRGIGTKSISASSDPAVAVSFNNSPMIRNRLFEQEYLDVSRVEVLRGPQGTLYGRNATAGVVNMIPNFPTFEFDSMIKGEVGSFGSVRGQLMANIPLSETFSVRGAASMTKRDGFDENTFNNTSVNGRDLFSTRISALWEPNDRFNASFIWEHFGEDDNRSRTGKQLCARDPGTQSFEGISITDPYVQFKIGQGCLPKSLYDQSSYSAPSGWGMAQIYVVNSIGWGHLPDGEAVRPIKNVDPYANVSQSKDLRKVSTSYDPTYYAKNDVAQLNFKFELTDKLTIHSQSLYTEDNFVSTQDYARYVSSEVINSSDDLLDIFGTPIIGSDVAPGGMFADPQLGASNRILSVDMSKSENRQWYQELRLQSSFDGRFNFSLGANYLDFKSKDDYYVFNNIFTMISQYFYNRDGFSYPIKTNNCQSGVLGECVYVDLTPMSNLAGDGHNYFRSKNEVSTTSWGVFGEAYVGITDKMNLTLGLRYTDDTKVSTPYPSQLLLGAIDLYGIGPNTGGSISRGFRALPDIEQKWDAVTGRLVLDWKPTDEYMLYASYARGYKGGGANPPRADINPAIVQYQPLAELFDPEYVNAFELGIKANTLDGRLRMNATAFYYDYEDYQVSQIVDRISLNENFDATSMGLEFEAVFQPTRDFRLDANIGLLKTKIGDGEGSIDVMNRTQGNEDWVVLRPWLQVPSNCVAPKAHVEKILSTPGTEDIAFLALSALCGGSARIGSFTPGFYGLYPYWSIFGIEYNPLTDAPNGGRGFKADLSGNELPNAPRFTANIGAQYTFHFSDWELTTRADYYRQSDSYFRVYNTDYDKLKGWGSANVTLTLENSRRDFSAQLYVKNVFDEAPIVDAFTNSDDSMLTTNVFTLDPRIIGFNLTKRY